MTQLEKRLRFSRWLAEVLGLASSQADGLKKRLIHLEPLEGRQLMAADGFLMLLGSAQSQQFNSTAESQSSLLGSPVAGEVAQGFYWSASQAEGELTPEGEPGDDLVAFAKALAATTTKFYGADWCRFCSDQKRLFEDGAKYLPYIDVTNPDRTPKQIATDNNITTYPTWVFPDGSRLTGSQPLATISQRSGVAIPQSSTPSLPELPNVNVATRSPLHIPIDAFSPNGTPLTITVTSSNPSLISASVLDNNRSMRIKTDFGDMVFQLFEDKAPRATGRVIQLAEAGDYDGLIFHRVIDGFMIQGGDPAGTGAGGSPLGNFDDQFHLDLQHNRSGVLSFAKSGDDTNNSQFFITAGPTRHLDFNHSVFGQLVEGDSVRNAISKTATNASDRPLNNVVMQEVTIFDDTENGLVLLKASGTGTGTSNITVRVSDGQGNEVTRSFVATVVADTANGAPFFNDIPVLQATPGTTLTHTLTSQDKEGDPVIYSVERVGNVQYDLSVNAQTGVVSLTPPANFTGELQFLARVRQSTTATTQDTFDSQLVRVQVSSLATLGLTLNSASDSGQSNTDGITNATSLVFTVTGTSPGATVEIVSGTQVLGLATASSATTQVTVQNVSSLAEGPVTFSARQRVNGQTNATSANLNLTLDRTAPVALASGAVPASSTVGTALNVDLNHPEEGQGLRYALENAPAGMTIGNADGRIQWTPQESQIGSQSFTVVATDLAGNQRSQTFSINVVREALMGIRLATVSLAGAPITTISVGQQFKVQVFVEDLRPSNDREGVFSAYMNLAFDPSVVQPIATSPIRHVEPYNAGTSGIISANQIAALGANATSLQSLGASERLFVEVTFTALAAGNAGLRSERSSDADQDIGLYSKNDAVSPDEVAFGASSFVVGVDYQVNDDTFNFDEDTGPHTLNVLTNDTPQTGVVLTIVEVSTPTGAGNVTIASDGKSLRYTPLANFHGAETFTYTVANAQGVRQSATVTIQVTEVNDPPLAVADTFDVFQNSALNVLDVLANDTQGADVGVGSETLRVTQVTTGSNGGTIEVGPSGTNVRYTPVTSFVGTETFSYTLSDGRGGTSQATVTVTVRPLIPPPTARDDNFTVVEDSPSASHDVLANDSPLNPSHTLTIRSVGSSNVGSTVSVASDRRSILYQPAANFAGQEVITYTLEASDGGIATGRATFTVTNVNDPPSAVDDTRTVESSGGPVTIDVLSNDFDVDPGDTFTITSVTQPPSGSGTLAIASGAKSLTYTAPSNTFAGQFTFTYTITDSTGLTDTATVNLTVRSFTPRSISGKVKNAQTGDTALQFQGVQLSLVGTSLTGTEVNQNATIAADGSFQFANLAPGEYRLTRPALPFFVDSGQEIVISSAPTDGNFTTELMVSGSLHARHIDVRDFLGSTFRKTLTAAISPTGTTRWMTPTGTWSGLSNVSFVMNTTELRVNARNSTSQQVAATIPLTHNSLSRTVNGDSQLIKLRGDTTRFNLAPVTTSAAEGESLSTSSQVTNNRNSLNPNGQSLLAEGEASPSAVPPSVGSAQLPNSQSQPTLRTVSSVESIWSPAEALRATLGSNRSRTLATSVSNDVATEVAHVESEIDDADQISFDPELLDLLASEADNRARS